MAEVKDGRLRHRQRQALETRRTITRSARDLFARHGYAETSIDAVAQEAGVAPRTVFAIFGTKKAILGAICDEWLAEAGVMEAVSDGLRAGDLRQRLALVAHASRRQWESERGVRAMLEGAAASDTEVARMLAGWKNDRAESLRSVVIGFEGELQGGLEPARAGAIIRALTSGEVYAELVAGEGWTPDQYETWVGELLTDLLVRH